ncbi:PREDICTED: uncharacterized protein LOC108364839, partial [Rhagoletis zephyria]|uniref:uncharacterized protein LOC108364839 n=1 Tax=Rhagoletis zephyria TaxID=28612 RepID=UPI000811795D
MINIEDLPRLESLSPVKDIEAYDMTILENKKPDKVLTTLKCSSSAIIKAGSDSRSETMWTGSGCRYINQ